MHYLGVWIDFNNDGKFDESNEEILHESQRDKSYTSGHYQLSIAIPKLDRNDDLDRQYRMRIVLSRTEQNRKPCYNAGHGETRDYAIHIIPKQNDYDTN